MKIKITFECLEKYEQPMGYTIGPMLTPVRFKKLKDETVFGRKYLKRGHKRGEQWLERYSRLVMRNNQ